MINSSKLKTQIKDTPPLIVSNILPREDNYMIITKRELTQIDNFTSWMDIYSECCLLLGSAFFGFTLSLIPI